MIKKILVPLDGPNIMSTNGPSNLIRWLYGSVAYEILQDAPCPVFLVKPE